MNRRRRTLPPVPPKAPSELRPLIAAMTEILETGEGVRGDPLDRKVTLRDILDSGIGKLRPGMRPGQDGNLDPGTLPPAPDLSIPPAPQGFDAQGSFYGMVNLSWTIPGQQYLNHAYTNVFRSEEDNFANAEIIGREAGAFYSDYVRDDAIDPDDPTKLKGYYYWITFTSTADIEGPPNSPNGTYAEPIADLGYVIELITGQIDEGALAQSLKEEIDRIGTISETLNGPESLDGTVAHRIAAEREARIAALDEERVERVDSLIAEQQAREAAISFEAQARQDAVAAEAQDRVAAVAAERDARVVALQAEQGARAAAITSVEQQVINGDAVLASQLSTLTATVGNNSADISSEQQARVSGDAALASDITTLQTQVGDNEAVIVSESEARIENDALRASQLAVIAATYNANTASIFSLEEVRINDREATATRIDGLEVQVDDNEASIFQEQIARANADSALASQLSVLSAKIDALPTFANGFEAGLEFDRWVATSGHIIVAETSDAFSGEQSALISSTASSVATNAVPFAVSARIPNGTADAFASRRVRIGIAARAVSGGSAEFAVGYATSDGWFSGWHRHAPAAGWGIFEAQVEVPEVSNVDHYVVIWGDTSGSGGSVEVDRLLVDVADTEIPEITAQIETLQQVIVDNQQAMATQFDTLSTQFDSSIATVNGELLALSTADEALASSVQTLQAEIDSNAAAIVDEQTTRASATDALAQQLNAVDARVDQSRALITSEAQARADEDSALGLQISMIDARVDGSRSLIASEQQARADADSALAIDIQTLTAATGDLAADIQSESTARATADEAIAENITDLWAGIDGNEARITDESRVRATQDDLLAAVQRVMSASRGASSATFYSLEEVRTTDVEATAQRIDGVEVALDDAKSAFEDEVNLLASEDLALGSRVTTLQSELGDDIATVKQEMNTEVSRLDGLVTVQASKVDTVQSQLGDDIASVQTSMNTQIERVDGELTAIGAQYTAKVDVNGLVGGFGIYNDGTEVEAGFDVDRLWVGRTNSDKRKPFIVQGGTTYIDSAMIRNASIQEGQLGPITIGKLFKNDGTPITTVGGLIRADAIDADNLSVASAATFYGTAQSGNFSPGRSGWRLLQNGNAEFNQGTFNGQVEFKNVTGAGSLASKNSLSYSEVAGTKPPTDADKTGSNTALDTARVAGSSAANVRQWALSGNSALTRVNNWVKPDSTLIDGNKIYTGEAYVDTLQIKGQAVTVPRSATGGYFAYTSFYAPIPMNAIAIAIYTQGAGRGDKELRLIHNDAIIQVENPKSGTTGALGRTRSLSVGTHTFGIDTPYRGGHMNCNIIVLGVKR